MADDTSKRSESGQAAQQQSPFRYGAELAEKIETKWQARWEKEGTFVQPNPGDAGFDGSKPKFYCLDMFPYPSGAGLHVGHPEGYTGTDIISRYKRMRGYNVLHPMGWDAFGLPAEQYAIKTGVHPAVTTQQAIDNFRRQLKRFGFSYDWSREFGTIDQDYYKWTQWIFLQIYKSWFDPEAKKARPIAELEAEFAGSKRAVRINPSAGEYSTEDKAHDYGDWAKVSADDKRKVIDSWRLAYVAEQMVNWCPKLGTALANEEVIDGKSERGDHPVFRLPLKQWLFRITAYGDRLIEGLQQLDWPDSTKSRQADWIGKSEGAEVDFALKSELKSTKNLRVYTTRPDTLFGATYMVVAPEHPLVDDILAAPLEGTDKAKLEAYVTAARNRAELDRQLSKEKTGVFTGAYATNPTTGQDIPIWVADYVLMGYGEGAIMAVPGHDERDFEFAKTFDLPIIEVVKAPKGQEADCFSGHGTGMNSHNDEVSLDGLETPEAKKTIIAWLEKKGLGRARVNFRLRDWGFSRQRYWGEPFPVVWDEAGHHHPIDEAKLPLVLPELADYSPEESNEPQAMLAKVKDWVSTTAGEAGIAGLAEDAIVTRETNTMPGWAGSCWYFIRYCDPKNADAMIGSEAEKYWLGENGVDLYIGGAEHAVLHLLYARFWHKVLHDLGHVQAEEPFRKLFHQGLITSHAYQDADKKLIPVDEVEEFEEGSFRITETKAPVQRVIAKMSKSLKNVVNPDDIIADFGADTFRLYEMYMGPLEASKPWNTKDISGLARFMQRVWRLMVDEDGGDVKILDAADEEVEKQLHRMIATVTDNVDRIALNTSIARMIEFTNLATSKGGLTKDQAGRFVKVLSPFAPHIAEELWEKLGHTDCVSASTWPTWDEAMLKDDTVELPVQIMGKVRSRITVAADADKKTLEEAALADEKIKALIEGKTVRKVVVVPGRMVNIVAN